MIKKNVKKCMGVIWALVMICGLIGCGEKEEKNAPQNNLNAINVSGDAENVDIQERELEDEFISYTSNFSVELFKESVYKDMSEGKNVLISPESVLCALSMTANGAGSDTLEEMENVVMGDTNIGTHNEYMYTYNNNLLESQNVKFNMANSIWVRDDEERISVKESFADKCYAYYNADVYLAEFDSSTVTDINNWVDDKTDGMISELVKNIDDAEVMYLINAIAFEGEWKEEYEEHQVNENGLFTSCDGKKQDVNMLCSTETYFIDDDNGKGFIKEYKGGKFAFMAILPDEELGVEGYIENMTGDNLIGMYKNRQYKDVIVLMPEFSYEYDIELSDSLTNMGMGQAFVDTADFSNMATTKSGYLYISKVFHKTYIQVNRQGTKAAAVTAVVMNDETCAEPEEPESVILDRPFIYAIIDTETGLPIFLGVLNSVE